MKLLCTLPRLPWPAVSQWVIKDDHWRKQKHHYTLTLLCNVLTGSPVSTVAVSGEHFSGTDLLTLSAHPLRVVHQGNQLLCSLADVETPILSISVLVLKER